MINKKNWEKSFNKVNGRNPSEEEYQNAVSDGIVKPPSDHPHTTKKSLIIVASIIGALFLIILTFIATLLLFPVPSSNHTEHFNDVTSDSAVSKSATTSTSTQPSASDNATQDLNTFKTLTLNEQIALLVQSYARTNPKTTVLAADNIAMTANGNNGVNDGYIEWYDHTHTSHKLDVLITGQNITFSYIDATTGQAERKTDTISSVLAAYFQTASAKQATDTLADKMVTPKALHEANKAEQDIDTSAISRGDISSLVGTWKNSIGSTITINTDKSMVMSDGKTAYPYTITLNHKDSKIPYLGVSSVNGVSGFALALFKINFVNPDGDQSDTHRPRLLITQSSENFPAENYYYRQ